MFLAVFYGGERLGIEERRDGPAQDASAGVGRGDFSGGLALILEGGELEEIGGGLHLGPGVLGAAGLEEDASEQVVGALHLIVIAADVGGEGDGLAQDGLGVGG